MRGRKRVRERKTEKRGAAGKTERASERFKEGGTKGAGGRCVLSI